MQMMEEEFQFLFCGKCQREAQNPQLLDCLHTLCSECLQESKPIGHCPVCRVPISRHQDNLLFMHLQASLITYRRIVSGEGLTCGRCKGDVEFWCPECKQFLCVKCQEDHQWWMKQKSHEVHKIGDMKADSATRFLTGARKSCTLFCSNPTHSNQVLSIYCRQCHKPLCCSCALLDTKHSGFHCDIGVEIQQRKEELSRMSEELLAKQQRYEQTYGGLQQREQEMEKVRNDTQAFIKEKVEEIVRHVREKGDQFLEEVDRQLHEDRRDTRESLQAMTHVLHRMQTSRQLVENMAEFASNQVVMDMHPFVKESLDELKKERMPMAGLQPPARNFPEVKNQLQVLWRKVTGTKDPVAASNSSSTSSPFSMTPSTSTPRKRPLVHIEKSSQTTPKTPKYESHESEEGETSTRHTQEAMLCSSCGHERTSERDRNVVENSEGDVDHSLLEIVESEVPSILISSSDDTDADTM